MPVTFIFHLYIAPIAPAATVISAMLRVLVVMMPSSNAIGANARNRVKHNDQASEDGTT
jgi:hypothetical protein